MARNRDPFTSALASLRERVQSGQLANGSPVIVLDEAAHLHLSPTPIREALARLSGEGLVERAPSGGYVTLRLDATMLSERYGMAAHYVRIATELTADALGSLRPPRPLPHPFAPTASVRRLFAILVDSAGHRLLAESFQRVDGQLDLPRRVEPLLFEDLTAEAEALYAAYDDPSPGAFAEAAGTYHRRRMSAAGALAALLREGRERAACDETA